MEFHHPQKFSWILAAIQESQNHHTSFTFYRGLFFIWVWYFVGLDFHRFHRSIINQFKHWHWRDVTVRCIFPFSNRNFTYCRWRRWGWRKWRRMTLLFHRCPWGWWRCRGRTWQACNHDRNEVFRIADSPNSVFNEMWFLTLDPFVWIPVFIAKLSERQYCWRVIEDLHCQEYIQLFDIHNCLFMRLHTSPLAVMTIVRLHDFVKVSISAWLKSFLLIMCIDGPESTTNSLYSGFNVDAGKHPFSGDEKNVALWCSFNFNTFLASFHNASRAPCSCHSVSSCERSSNFGALGLRSWGAPGQL